MDNAMDSMLETYLFETNSLLEQLDELLINSEKDRDFTEEDIGTIFRIMHTIKGASGMMEYKSLEEISHHIEDLFFYIRDNGMDGIDGPHRTALFNLMFKSTDQLRDEVRKVENNEPLSTNIDSMIAEINTFLAEIKSGSGAQPEAQEAQEAAPADAQTVPAGNGASLPADKGECFIHIFFDEGCGMENLRAFMLVNSLRDVNPDFRFYPPDVETNSDTSETIIRDGFFLAFDARKSAETAISIVKDTNNIRSYEIVDNPAFAAPAEENVPAEGKKESSSGSSSPAASKSSSKSSGSGSSAKQSLISVNLSKLDALMAVVSEIVITESMVVSSPELKGLKLDTFLSNTRQLRKLTDQLQEISTSLRMVPISATFQKMNRIVRDMKQELGKDVRLTIVGEETEVDKNVVDNIGDPIMHIVRNSMDHGIEENVEDRIKAGKNPQGEIILAARHSGNEVIISITDDGQGMNPAALLAKAKQNGLLYKPEEEYTQKEILGFIMMPGFSTNTEVTQYSGRGVGMDVVKKNVEALGGNVTISSEYGKGTTMTLKIPLTMAIADGMEISVGGYIFTIPIANVIRSLKIQAEDVTSDSEGHELIRVMGEFYPLVRLHRLYNIDTEVTDPTDGLIMLVESTEKSYCMLIDELLGERQIVVKPLPDFLDRFNIKDSGISGCTIQGDGNISLILDIQNLYHAALSII